MGRERAEVEWWSSTYESLTDGDCKIEDGTLGELLVERGVRIKGWRRLLGRCWVRDSRRNSREGGMSFIHPLTFLNRKL